MMKNILIVFVSLAVSLLLYAQEYKSNDEAKGLNVGAIAPSFTAIDADSVLFDLDKALKKGPVVLIFYRGFWCPVCNRHLATIQDSLKLITDMGATVIAVSPEKPEFLDKMANKTGAEFKLLYDDRYKIANAYDVSFMPGRVELFGYNTFLRANLKETHSDDSQRLPIPATYIISQSNKIVWRHFDSSYKTRSLVSDIITNLP